MVGWPTDIKLIKLSDNWGGVDQVFPVGGHHWLQSRLCMATKEFTKFRAITTVEGRGDGIYF